MVSFKILGAAAMLSLAFATPVFAQAAIQEPGAFAFYYPNNDVLNGGRPTPAAAGMDAKLPVLFGSNPYAAMDSPANQIRRNNRRAALNSNLLRQPAARH